ncbi:probable cation transporter HKT6 [Macadamia integrifolia]|uniref:probable cation transporter HKT6 n=1 Tax=Macadamia integrifolia TaxID=60698 RepID=UPI001C4ED28A|nr:probable cation transporter HKT6 [Macadamia integrifolia]
MLPFYSLLLIATWLVPKYCLVQLNEPFLYISATTFKFVLTSTLFLTKLKMKMSKFVCFITKKLQNLSIFVNPFWIQICYFISVSSVGFLVLKVLKPRNKSFRPNDFDVFFMSVSATTVSSMSTLEMEVFSDTQLTVLTILMVLGGEVFVSVLGLHWLNSKFKKQETQNKVIDPLVVSVEDLRYKSSIRYLSYVVWAYFLVIHIVGSTMISIYMSLVSSARNVLKNKGLHLVTFSMFTTVSTFTNCGFIPTNENMIVFSKHSGLLLILIPQILLGNTLYPPCLRFLIWVLWRLTKREELNYLLRMNFSDGIGYNHLLPFLHSCLLVVTVFGFIVIQFILFCCMEWNSEALKGLNCYQKLVAALFQSVNSRHTGESVVDLSIISPAILVLYVVMMYLPPYTTFLPRKNDEQSLRSNEKMKKRREKLVENLLFSQLSYLAIFIILICITEREKLREDPLNFTVLNIVIEVISAYGNVGFTTGYSCERQLKHDGYCKDAWYGFSGRWSNEGKLILILVMFFGRLKKFNMEGGKGWKLM